MEWSNAQCVNTPTTMILSTMVGIYFGLNYFSHIIYAPQINMYQNIAKLLNYLSN